MSDDVGIRELKQNASAVVARVAAGESVRITVRGRPVAQLNPLPRPTLQALLDSGRARAPRRPLRELPEAVPGPALSAALINLRSDERY